MQQDSAYTLCPTCKSLNMKRATRCYSCRADLRRATKVAVDRSFTVRPVARYLTPEEIAERDAEEKARREAEAAQRTPRNPVGAVLRVVSAPFVIVGAVLRRSVMILQTGARAGGTGVQRAARVGLSAGSSVAQTGASAGRVTARAVGAGAKAGGRAVAHAAETIRNAGRAAGGAIGVLGRRAATGTKATGTSAARVASTAARSTARVGSSAVSATARRGAGAARATSASSRRAAMASAAASRRAARASLATGRRAAAGAGAAGTALRGMTRDPRLNSRGALGVMLVVSILLILGGVTASWLAVSSAGGGAAQTANMPLLIVGVIALAIGITWAVGIVRRLRTSNPGAE
jgi:hypothetical protein